MGFDAKAMGRFWAKVDRNCPGGCWVWTATMTWDGYGQFGVNGKMVYSHRLAYEITFGEIQDGMQIDHTCHNRSCVNPGHLRLCTLVENARNRHKGRHNTSGFKGVSWSGTSKKWVARIGFNGTRLYLGVFNTKEDAYAAYCESSLRLHGEFSSLK